LWITIRSLAFGRRIDVDDDPLGLLIAPSPGGPVDRLEADGEPERLGERLNGRDHEGVGIVGQRLARQLKPRLLDPSIGATAPD
jgi:hypothetical protein